MASKQLLLSAFKLHLIVGTFHFGFGVDSKLFGQELSRIETNSNMTLIVADLSEVNGEVSFFDVSSNAEHRIERASLKKIKSPITTDEAAQIIGLPRLFAWKASEISKRSKAVGKLARISPQVVYTTLTNTSGLKAGSKLSVHRLKEPILDPDTKKTIGFERPKIAELEVLEVGEQFSKSKVIGNLETELQVGDEVQQLESTRIAVFPFHNDNGVLSTVGESLSEEISQQLVSTGIVVVERLALKDALREMEIQSNQLIDEETTVKIGKLAGANIVVSGKIIPRGNSARAYLKLIDVATGTALFAASRIVTLPSSRSMASGSLENPSTDSGNSQATSVTTFKGSFESGRLKSMSSIQLEPKVSNNYILTTKFNKYDADAIIFMLPINNTNVMVILDNEFRKESGIALIKNNEVSQSPARTRDITVNGSNEVLIRVRANRDRSSIIVTLNGKEIINWSGSTQDLSSKDAWIPPDRTKIGIGTTNCTIELIAWQIKEL